MPPRARRRFRPGDEAGFTVVQYVAAIGLVFLVTVMLLNASTLLFARAMVRAALDQGVRVGSAATASAAQCERTAQQARQTLLGGTLGRGVRIRCGAAGSTVLATATVVFEPGFGIPTWRYTVTARAVKEQAPP
jgi:hypothetical protein